MKGRAFLTTRALFGNRKNPFVIRSLIKNLTDGSSE
jgi:hypothetical protein